MTEDNAGNDSPKEPLSFGRVVMISLLLMGLPMVVETTFRWTMRWQGFISGLITALIFVGMMAVVLVPPLLVARLIFRRWKPGRIFRGIMFGVPLLWLAATVVNLVMVTPAQRFKESMGLELPANAKKMRGFNSGGVIADRGDEYYFETTPEETDRLIRGLSLRRDQLVDWRERVWCELWLPESPTTWPGAVRYHGDRRSYFYTLITDGTKTRVWIQVLGI